MATCLHADRKSQGTMARMYEAFVLPGSSKLQTLIGLHKPPDARHLFPPTRCGPLAEGGCAAPRRLNRRQ